MMHLLDFLFPPRVDERALRGVSDDEFLVKIAPRLVPETRPGTVALLSFGDASVRSAIHEAKYHGSERAFRLLGLVLAEYLRDCDDIRTTRLNLVVLVPVPLGKGRLKERGFNQAEEVAKRAVRELGIKIETGLLIRTRETASQVSLPRHKREKNMRGAFLVSPKLEERRRINPTHTYILIDDVLTTGATLQACIDALKDAGARHIIPLALAH
ncbi:MAG: phosphoribosyltransferase family protein [bacterium]|nr:phosphoribosyltransferase family protein [bacterium]